MEERKSGAIGEDWKVEGDVEEPKSGGIGEARKMEGDVEGLKGRDRTAQGVNPGFRVRKLKKP